jgi:hypothetical protein
MAFNPFTTFQKNKRFWMAMMTLIAMVTFVFCTGTRADLQDKIIYFFTRGGQTAVEVAGHKYTIYDLNRFRDERNSVNQFMRHACEVSIENINRMMQKVQEQPLPADPKERQKQEETLIQLTRVKLVLADRMRHQPLYFEGGVKLDDIIEFKLWQAQADKLGIRLLDDEVDYLVRMEFFSPGFQNITPEQIQQIWWDARRGKDFSDRDMRRAVTEEFRVRMARLAMIEMKPGSFFAQDPRLPVPIPGTPIDQRLHVTLARLWDVYKEKRSEFDVTLVPIVVGDFTRDLGNAPDDAALQAIFDKYKTARFDPSSPLPSFQTPEKAQIEFVMADPTSPIYLGAARARLLLERTLPLVGNPLASPMVTAARAGAFGAARQKNAEDILEALSQKKYDTYGGADIGANEFIWPLAAYLAERDPPAIAGLVGNAAASFGDPAAGGPALWAGFLAGPAIRDKELIEAGISAESKRRTKPAALVAISGATGQPLDVISSAVTALKLFDLPSHFGVQFRDAVRMGRTLLPLAVVEPELEKVAENRIAEQWASRNLMTVKRLIDKNAKPEAIKRVINENVPRYNLTHVTTKDYYDRFSVPNAPELQPLRDAYERYYREINWFEKRDLTPERLLKDDEFYKMFFDNEPFAASSGTFQVRPWPPDIRPNQMQVWGVPGMNQPQAPNVSDDLLVAVQRHMQQAGGHSEGFRLLDKAQKPILFWRHDYKAPEFPQNLAAARPLVLAAWETEQAREQKALPKAKKIAEELAKSDLASGFIAAMSQQGGHLPIVLKGIAPLVPKTVGETGRGGHRDYFPYQLPKDTIQQARADMVKQLLELYDLKAPIKIELGLPGGDPSFVKEVNDINKTLFDLVKKENPKDPQGHFVQILVNKPHTVYYIAAVTSPPTPNPKDFQGDVLQFASEGQGQRFVDQFVTRAQQQLATDFHHSLIVQMRNDLGGWTPPDEETRKTFDKEETGS